MAQSLANVLLHIIFSTKERRPFIDLEIEKELYPYIVTTATELGCYVHRIGGYNDHIHILTTLPRTKTMSQVLEEIKKSSSKWIKTKGNQYYDFSWQKGFGIFSVSRSQQQKVEIYIDNQKEHHKKFTFQDEYRKLLELNNVSFNEKYVWE